jgi:carbon-monoxide dehydrogenase large subunit
MSTNVSNSKDEPSASPGWVGRQFNRKEDHRLTTGRGQYFADIVIPGMLHLVFVRSTHAHARITSIDTGAAKALPGVVAVVTGADIMGEIKSLPQPVVVPALPARYPTFWPLAVGKVKFHGEPVAAVIARDRYVAEDAAELVHIDYDPLPIVHDMEEALKPEAPIIHEGWPDNEMFALTFTGGATPESQAENDAEIDRLIKSAAIVVKRRYRVHRCGVTPMEPRGALANWDDGDGLKAWITTQRPHIDRLALSDVLDIPAEQVRVIAPRDQGGAFGVKAPFYREPILVCHMARKLKRPIRWLETREEHLMSVSQERDQIHDLEVAATREGRIVALRDRGQADNGDGCEGVYWGYLMPFLGAALLPNAYDIAKCDIKIRVACTNKAVLSPARSFGAYPTRFAVERAIDQVAREVGKQPEDVRRLNLIPELPYISATGVNYDSGDFLKVWDHLMKTIDIGKFRTEQIEARRKGRYIGVGFGVGAELSGVASSVLVPMENQPGYGAATVRLDPRGKVQVFEGDAPGGQGHETTMAQVVAHEFGIHPNDVTVMHGDTSSTPFGSGTIGARAGSYTVSAISEACRFLKKKIGRIMAHDLNLEGGPDDFIFADGQIVFTRSGNIRKTFREMVERIIMAPLNLPAGETAGLEHTAFFEAAAPMICFSAHAAFVDVDAVTGLFKVTRYVTSEDVGTVINPQIVEAQVQGGVVQGLSNCLFEQFIYDENGQQLTSSFENYKLATAADVPMIEVHHDAGTPCPHTPLGSRGLGEGIPGAVPGALTNAVCDALQSFGIEIDELPLRPNRIWRALQAARRSAAE